MKDLKHFGIKGMKWGIRRERGPDGTVGGAHPASEDAVRAVKTQQTIKATGSLNSVSSKDLQHLVNRMNLEQSYIKMTMESTPTKTKGGNFIKDFIKKEAASFFTTGQFRPGVRKIHSFMKKNSAPPTPKVKAPKLKIPKSKTKTTPPPRNPFGHPSTSRNYPKGSPFNMRPNPAYQGPRPLPLGTPVYKIHTIDDN
jgi:hypothetical protein